MFTTLSPAGSAMAELPHETATKPPAPLADRSYAVASRTRLPLHKGPLYLEVMDGCIALERLLPDGRRQILDILGPGRILGPGIADSHACSAISLTYTRLDPLVDSQQNTLRLSGEVRTMLRRCMNHATLLGRKTAPERVASALLDLAGQFSKPTHRPRRGISFILYLTRADLADWLGLTLETVSRCLNQLKRSGLIDFRSPELVSIIDPKGLTALAGYDPATSPPLPQTDDGRT